MLNENGLGTFIGNLHQEVIREAEVEGNEQLWSETFTALVAENLIEAGELEDAQPCYYRSPRLGLEVSGYGLADEGRTLDLLLTRYKQTSSPSTMGKTEIDTGFKLMANFLDKALAGYHKNLEEASPAFDMALAIWQARNGLERVRFFLLTSKVAKIEFKGNDQAHGLESSYHIWDARRLYRYDSSGQHREPIHIDFQRTFDQAIPCITAPETNADYTTYLAILPGNVLEAIYAEHGPRLLELNVRSFLQARGKVNKGIRDTLREEPERFLAYNNGISATAGHVQLVDLPGGGRGIGALNDFQIVNGGQTTASLHNVVKRDKSNISGAFVQAKITVIDNEKMDEMVSLISRYSNSQNKVNDADFSANDPFHVRMEELSRTIWAPATDGTQRQTRWFYERARGQYQDAIGRQGTPARVKQFRLAHPNSQRFTKTDLAKFENTWAQLPHLVSLGAQKNFRELTIRLSERKRFEPDQLFFQRHVAKAILFRRTEKLVSAQNFGGYRANIVTYTLAYLTHRTASRIDLDRIWAEQNITPVLAEAIVDVSRLVYDAITDPPGGRNVTEWCKRSACWERVRELDVGLNRALWQELVETGMGPANGRTDRGIDEDTPEEQDMIARALEVEAETWLEVSNWAKETGNLQSWQRSIAYSLGRQARQGRPPSRKQAKQGLLLLEEAERLGYRAD